jgi:hypothetical protein
VASWRILIMAEGRCPRAPVAASGAPGYARKRPSQASSSGEPRRSEAASGFTRPGSETTGTSSLVRIAQAANFAVAADRIVERRRGPTHHRGGGSGTRGLRLIGETLVRGTPIRLRRVRPRGGIGGSRPTSRSGTRRSRTGTCRHTA